MNASLSLDEAVRPWHGTAPERRASVWVALIALAAAALFTVGSHDFCLDDAWIHLSYAKSIRLGEGLSYNPYDRELGFSSPLWVLLLSALPIVSAPVASAKAAGWILHAATSVAAANLAISIGARIATIHRPVPLRALGLLCGTFVAVQPTLLQGATSGMEVPLAAATLMVAMLLTYEGGRTLAYLAGMAATLARPECLPVLAFFAVTLAVRRRSFYELLTLVGGACGLALWAWYCFSTHGSPWPNTRYAKASAWSADGLRYVMDEVLVHQAWLLSLTGVVAIGLALLAARRERVWSGPWALLAAYLGGVVTIAVSRPLHEGVGFYEWRYFAVLAPIPYILLCLGLTRVRPRIAMALAVPVTMVIAVLLPQIHRTQRQQELNIQRLHTQVATWVATELPPRATVAVEGAGALRFHTPRTMHIVDTLGLNDYEIIHAGSDAARVCVIADREPDFFVLPDHILSRLSGVFEFQTLHVVHEPNYALVKPAHPLSVYILRSDGLTASWKTRCAALDTTAGSTSQSP